MLITSGTPGTPTYTHDDSKAPSMEVAVKKANDELEKLRAEMEAEFEAKYKERVQPLLENVLKSAQRFYPQMKGFGMSMGMPEIHGMWTATTIEEDEPGAVPEKVTDKIWENLHVETDFFKSLTQLIYTIEYNQGLQFHSDTGSSKDE